MNYPALKMWSIKSLRLSLKKLEGLGIEEYTDKNIKGQPISRQMLEAEISRRTAKRATKGNDR